MNKKNVKYIKQIADRLPVVYEETVSGFFVEEGETKPNIVSHPYNHVRRMRKAYEQLGMDGIQAYLDTIYKMQLQRKENA